MDCFSLFLTFGSLLQYMSYLYVCIGVYLKHAFFGPISVGVVSDG